jgi:hypothetical protein
MSRFCLEASCWSRPHTGDAFVDTCDNAWQINDEEVIFIENGERYCSDRWMSRRFKSMLNDTARAAYDHLRSLGETVVGDWYMNHEGHNEVGYFVLTHKQAALLKLHFETISFMKVPP